MGPMSYCKEMSKTKTAKTDIDNMLIVMVKGVWRLAIPSRTYTMSADH